ncbi:MAG TPA: 3-phosphoserine/phosphohydroxythreonine transaminase, partial [Planctomycetaceae bacterium]|nr:3-phosphoserine/phosphohydroxythreonine transaminase [Planctomycetaceae bacterium]
MEKRVFDFSPGPAVLPVSVLEEAQRSLVCMPGAGISILEMSHRSAIFTKIIETA